MSRIAVIGGTGYAGSHILAEAVRRGHTALSVARTAASDRQEGVTYIEGSLLDVPGLACMQPQPYLSMLALMRAARMVLTDSGGVQEETTALGVPCLTLRENTERPITVTEGSNAIAGRDPAVILALSRDILRFGGKAGRVPQYWDGHAADRIAVVVRESDGGAHRAAGRNDFRRRDHTGNLGRCLHGAGQQHHRHGQCGATPRGDAREKA